MKIWYRIAIGVAIAALAVILLKTLIGGSTVALFMPAGPVAGAQDNIIVTSILLMLIVVVPMFIFLFAVAWKYRASNPNSVYDPEKTHRAWREIILWMIPAVLIAVLAVMSWKSVHELDPYATVASSAAPNAAPLVIQVVALQWKWLFIYPEQNIATVNFIEFPVNTPVHFELTADAPMSSFWIPQLGSQIYAMAAMETQLNLLASTPGEYAGKDTEINGAGYAGMTFVAKATSQADFNNWLASVQGAGTYPALDENAYNTLSAPSENNPPAYYSSVNGDLFDGVMAKYMEPSSTMDMQTETSTPNGNPGGDMQQSMPMQPAMPGMSM